MACHLSALSHPLDDGARQLNMRTSFGGKSKGKLGGGPTLYRSLNEHGGPVPAKLTQTAKEMGIFGKRPTHAALTYFQNWCETIRLWGCFSRFSIVNFDVSR